MTNTLETLPFTLLNLILSFLDHESWLSMSLVSKYFLEIVRQSSRNVVFNAVDWVSIQNFCERYPFCNYKASLVSYPTRTSTRILRIDKTPLPNFIVEYHVKIGKLISIGRGEMVRYTKVPKHIMQLITTFDVFIMNVDAEHLTQLECIYIRGHIKERKGIMVIEPIDSNNTIYLFLRNKLDSNLINYLQIEGLDVTVHILVK